MVGGSGHRLVAFPQGFGESLELPEAAGELFAQHRIVSPSLQALFQVAGGIDKSSQTKAGGGCTVMPPERAGLECQHVEVMAEGPLGHVTLGMRLPRIERVFLEPAPVC